MSKDILRPDLSELFAERDKQQAERETIKMRVDELMETTDYELSAPCPVKLYPSNEPFTLQKGMHFFVYKKYDDYSHLTTDKGDHFSLLNSQELSIRKKE